MKYWSPKVKTKRRKGLNGSAPMDGTPERSWLGCRNALEVQLGTSTSLLLPRRAYRSTNHLTHCRLHSHPTVSHPTHLTQFYCNCCTVFCTGFTGRACDTRSETWGTPGASPVGEEGGGKGLSCSSATQPMTICTALCVPPLYHRLHIAGRQQCNFASLSMGASALSFSHFFCISLLSSNVLLALTNPQALARAHIPMS